MWLICIRPQQTNEIKTKEKKSFKNRLESTHIVHDKWVNVGLKDSYEFICMSLAAERMCVQHLPLNPFENKW